jgi:hypothetical protein
MPISDSNRARFEGIGLDLIRRELSVGSAQFVQIDDDSRRQAREWVTEQLAIRQRQEKSGRIWMTVGTVAAIVAAIAGLIAAWPVIKGWVG